jgi:hypothetical protein
MEENTSANLERAIYQSGNVAEVGGALTAPSPSAAATNETPIRLNYHTCC